MRVRFLSLAAGAGLVLASAAPSLADCAALDRAVKSAIQAGDTASLNGLAETISRDSTCDSTYVENARRAMSLAVLAAGQRDDGSFAPDFVLGAASIARPWKVSLAFGDLKYEARDYGAASEAYEAAINEIRNVRLVPKAPPREIEEYLAKRAYQAKSLAPTYIASRGFRGEPAGVIVPTFRNFSAVSVPVPIRFETDQAALTPDGEKAVDDLFNFLKTQPASTLLLVGHTDERGSQDHNDVLSMARAKTVAAALKARGLDWTIETEGHGESQPFPADDRSKYDQDELYAFDRRVEYRVIH
jgi:outer membrane protein OmpA-like peptidoglycan-associated protein